MSRNGIMQATYYWITEVGSFSETHRFGGNSRPMELLIKSGTIKCPIQDLLVQVLIRYGNTVIRP